MNDLWTALALVLVIEGCLYALVPKGMKRAAAAPSKMKIPSESV